MAVNKDFKVKNGAIIGGDISVPSGNIFVQHTAGQYSAFRGPASQSANVVIQGDAGNGAAYWISAKQSDGALHIGGNGGTEPALGAVTINGSGNVGIGIAAPLNRLHVVSSSTLRSAIFETTAGTTSAIMLKNTGSVTAPQLLSTNDDLAFQTNAITRVTITSAGHVGIATAAPVTGTGFPVFTVGATRPISLVSGLGGSSVYGSALTVNMAIDTSTGTPTATVGAGTAQQGGTAMVTDYTGNITFHSYNTGLETGGTRTVNMYDVARMRIGSDGAVQIGGALTNIFGGQLLVQKSTLANIDIYSVDTSEAKIRLYNANNNSAIGSGAGGQLVFYANSSVTERMRLHSNGNFSIGTASDIGGRMNVEAGASVPLMNFNATSNNNFLRFQHNSNNVADVGTANSIITSGASASDFGINARTGNVVFATGQIERMRVTPSGSVQIGSSSGGVTSPLFVYYNHATESAIQVRQDGAGPIQLWAGSGGGERARLEGGGNLLIGTTLTAANGRLHVASTNSSGGLGSGEQVLILRNTVATASARGAGIRFDMGSYTSGAAQIDLVNTGNANDGYLSFSTRSSGTIAERMVINASGVTVTGTLTETSTIRVKENVRDLEGSLAKVLGLRGVMYDMKDGSALNQVGLIAEEVHAVVPNVVYRDEEGEIAGVQYARLVAVLIEGMKEQEARIKHLEALVAKLVD